jgi:2-keto-4-pentenoate hydratase/2-oxohepta-3-ene-1,7-dioic acid hydratase in catechol pathway
MLEFIDAGEGALAEARRLADSAATAATLDSVRLLAPIPRPRSHLYCVGWNYLKHFNEGVGRREGQETELPEFPAFFSKPGATVISPGHAVAYDPNVTQKLDYEAELAVVIGRRGRSIREEDALEHVFGYTLANDVSAREVQRRHGGQWLKGKGMDTYCPLGPAIVTADEIPDPQQLTIEMIVNGERRQHASLATMIFPVKRLLAELSLGMTLEAGDILLTGTPDGVGFGRTPQVFLQPGDEMVVSIREIGALANRVEAMSLV